MPSLHLMGRFNHVDTSEENIQKRDPATLSRERAEAVQSTGRSNANGMKNGAALAALLAAFSIAVGGCQDSSPPPPREEAGANGDAGSSNKVQREKRKPKEAAPKEAEEETPTAEAPPTPTAEKTEEEAPPTPTEDAGSTSPIAEDAGVAEEQDIAITEDATVAEPEVKENPVDAEAAADTATFDAGTSGDIEPTAPDATSDTTPAVTPDTTGDTGPLPQPIQLPPEPVAPTPPAPTPAPPTPPPEEDPVLKAYQAAYPDALELAGKCADATTIIEATNPAFQGVPALNGRPALPPRVMHVVESKRTDTQGKVWIVFTKCQGGNPLIQKKLPNGVTEVCTDTGVCAEVDPRYKEEIPGTINAIGSKGEQLTYGDLGLHTLPTKGSCHVPSQAQPTPPAHKTPRPTAPTHRPPKPPTTVTPTPVPQPPEPPKLPEPPKPPTEEPKAPPVFYDDSRSKHNEGQPR